MVSELKLSTGDDFDPVQAGRSLADLLSDLGNISPERVYAKPAPGHATEDDLIHAVDHEDRLCELVEGTLIEKAPGFWESFVTTRILSRLWAVVEPPNLGLVVGANAAIRLRRGLVRMPSASFISWPRIPGGVIPREPIPSLAPDLVVEVLRQANIPKEMSRKRREYFQAGVRCVWEVDGAERTVTVYTAANQAVKLDDSQTLDGGVVLPGFTVAIRELFAELDQQAPGQT